MSAKGSTPWSLVKFRRALEDEEYTPAVIATVLHLGWDLDNYVALVMLGQVPILMTTDHGTLATISPTGVAEMRDKMREAADSCDAVLTAYEEASR